MSFSTRNLVAPLQKSLKNNLLRRRKEIAVNLDAHFGQPIWKEKHDSRIYFLERYEKEKGIYGLLQKTVHNKEGTC